MRGYVDSHRMRVAAMLYLIGVVMVGSTFYNAPDFVGFLGMVALILMAVVACGLLDGE